MTLRRSPSSGGRDLTTHSPAAIAAGLAVGVTAVSFAAILVRVALGDDPAVLMALALAFWRTFGGAVALGPFALRDRRRADRPLTAIRRRQLAASGTFLAAHFALFLGSLALTTVASSVTLTTMSPLFVALGGWWLLGEPTRRRTWIGMGVTTLGAVLIGVADANAVDLGPRALLGDAMAFTAAIAATGYLLIGRVTRRDVAAATYSATVYGWAAVWLLAVCLALDAPLWGYDTVTWLAILGIVAGPQLLGHTVFNTLLSSVSATVVAIVVLAEPVGSTILAWLLLDELPAPLFWLGAPFVLIGVYVATARRRDRTAHPVRHSRDQPSPHGSSPGISS